MKKVLEYVVIAMFCLPVIFIISFTSMLFDDEDPPIAIFAVHFLFFAINMGFVWYAVINLLK